MNDIKTTQLALIEFLISRREPASSELIANHLGISGKTVRTYLAELEPLLTAHGAHVESKTGSGIILVMDDEDQFQKYLISQRGSVRKEYSYLSNNLQRAHFIVRLLLIAKEPIQIDDLCEILFMNRTSILQDIELAKTILAKFELSIHTRNKQGLVIAGEEIFIRSCILYETIFYKNSYIVYDNENYNSYYNFDNNELVERLNKIIYQSQTIMQKIYLSYKVIHDMARLLVISAMRNEDGHRIIASDEFSSSFSERNSYYIARYIASQVEPILETAFEKADVAYLAVYIFANKSVLSDEDITNYNSYLKEKDIAFDLVMYLNNINQFTYMKADMQLINDISYNLPMIEYRLKYHFLQSRYEMSEFVPSMAIKLAMQSAVYLEKVMGLTFNECEVARLGQLIYPCFGRYAGKPARYKALVVSKYDKHVAKSIAERVQRNFSKNISEVTVLDMMDFTYQDVPVFDIIFTDINDPESLRQSEKQTIVPINLYFREKDKGRIRIQLRNMNPSMGSRMSMVVKEQWIFQDVNARNKEELFHQIETLMASSISMRPGIADHLKQMDQIYCPEAVDNHAIIMPLEEFSDSNFIAFFVLKKPILWKIRKCQVVIVIHQGLNIMVENMFESEYVSHLIEVACGDTQLIDNLIKKRDISYIMNCLNYANEQILSNSRRVS